MILVGKEEEKKLYSNLLVLARLVGCPALVLSCGRYVFLTLVVVADLGAGFRQVQIGRRLVMLMLTVARQCGLCMCSRSSCC